MTYPILVYGHAVLKKIATDIEQDYTGLQKLIDDLFDTMYHSEGLGLAAPQIGKSIRVFVIDGTPVAEDEPELANFKKAFINAHIVEKCGEQVPMNEGCLISVLNILMKTGSTMTRFSTAIKQELFNMNMIISTEFFLSTD
jgi:peptide deformylase